MFDARNFCCSNLQPPKITPLRLEVALPNIRAKQYSRNVCVCVCVYAVRFYLMKYFDSRYHTHSNDALILDF